MNRSAGLLLHQSIIVASICGALHCALEWQIITSAGALLPNRQSAVGAIYSLLANDLKRTCLCKHAESKPYKHIQRPCWTGLFSAQDGIASLMILEVIILFNVTCCLVLSCRPQHGSSQVPCTTHHFPSNDSIKTSTTASCERCQLLKNSQTDCMVEQRRMTN